MFPYLNLISVCLCVKLFSKVKYTHIGLCGLDHLFLTLALTIRMLSFFSHISPPHSVRAIEELSLPLFLQFKKKYVWDVKDLSIDEFKAELAESQCLAHFSVFLRHHGPFRKPKPLLLITIESHPRTCHEGIWKEENHVPLLGCNIFF